MALDTDLENEYTNRESELVKLKKITTNRLAKKNEEIVVKALYLFLYSHFEGFFKNALEMYLEEIISTSPKLHDLKLELSTYHIEELFNRLDDGNRKHPEYKKNFPDDAPLHRHWRRVDFHSSIKGVDGDKFKMDTNFLIKTESNLKPDVIRKLLYKSGFNLDDFDIDYGSIHRLVGIRNDIAHTGYVTMGEFRKSINLLEYNKMETLILTLMKDFKQKLISGFSEKKFLNA